MSHSLFLPRELFEPAPSRPAAVRTAPAAPMLQPRRGALHFTSGADVAADLLEAMRAPAAAFVERRRKPRTTKPLQL